MSINAKAGSLFIPFIPLAIPLEAQDRFLLMLSLAITLHAILLLGVHFSHAYAHSSNTLEITLVAHKNTIAPTQPDFLAQANQAGSGSLNEKAEVATTHLADFNDNEIHPIQSAQSSSSAKTPEEETSQQLTSPAGQTQTPLPANPSFTPSLDNDNAETMQAQASIEERELEIASLQAQLTAKEQAYAKRPRKQQITAVSAQEDPAAPYLDAWRMQIEQVGNRNYQALNINNLYGSLRLLVAIKADGSLAEIRLLKSSGNIKLDRAAIKVVRQAAPFAPLPNSIRHTTDILEIIRTWKFERGRYSL